MQVEGGLEEGALNSSVAQHILMQAGVLNTCTEDPEAEAAAGRGGSKAGHECSAEKAKGGPAGLRAALGTAIWASLGKMWGDSSSSSGSAMSNDHHRPGRSSTRGRAQAWQKWNLWRKYANSIVKFNMLEIQSLTRMPKIRAKMI